MKKVVFAVVLLAIILTAGILENYFVHGIFTELDNKLYSIEQDLHKEDISALNKVRDLRVWWEDKRKYLELISYSPDLRAFSVALAETEGSLECNDFLNAMSKCQSLIVMSSNTHKLLDFNIEDII